MKDLIIVRGGGDIATGTVIKLYQAGFPVLILETSAPSAIRRNVAFSEAVYEGIKTVENVTCCLAESIENAEALLSEGKIAMVIDPDCSAVKHFKPLAVVDGILAKKNLGTSKDMAEITVALGPGFTAGTDCDAVIETNRGHNLGRVIYDGCAEPNTGIPGIIGGFGKERVIHSPKAGILRNVASITDTVKNGDTIAVIETADGEVPVTASLDGILRGLIRDGYPVTEGFKIADIDPRADEFNNCFTVSDKARCIAGGVLEAVMHLKKERNL
ncbi:MAG: EF2563 family selenium-dependent molybdenum hydroxylase system protein [Clostridia bacterium]|nr:EF2563 family selenium-dependent molybdenum hydroxylase system protein [Clostridia bacterium]